MSADRIPNDRFGGTTVVEPSDGETVREDSPPRLEYYQTDEGNLYIEEADGPVGAWIEFDPNWGAK